MGYDCVVWQISTDTFQGNISTSLQHSITEDSHIMTIFQLQ